MQKPPMNRRGARAYTARVATLVSLLASSVLLLAPAASAQAGGDLEVDLSAAPATRTEPGGAFIFAVEVANTGDEDVTIDSLDDDVYGDLAAASNSCADLVGNVLAPGGTAECLYTGEFTGDAGDEQTNTVTVTGTTGEGDDEVEVSGSDSVTVSLTAADDDDGDDDDDDDGDTGVVVEYVVDPGTRPAPVGTFHFGVRVTNTGDEEVELITLRDSTFGNLDGAGDCDTGVMLDPDEDYTCAFAAEFEGNSGDRRTHTVRATVEDDDGDEATDTDSVEIRLTAAVDDDDDDDDDDGGTTIVVNNSSSSSSSAAAAASGGESSPTPSPKATLVRTGAESLPMGAGGLGLLVLGSLLVVTAERERRRRLYAGGRA